MNFLKNIFRKKEVAVHTYADFWAWFRHNERNFFDAVKNHSGVEKIFFNKISPKLAELKDGYFYLTGMYDDHTVELILTADGNPCNIVFVEELVAAAPDLSGWKFTALKPAISIDDLQIEMAGLTFSRDTLSFYSNDKRGYPDEVDIVFVHTQCDAENKKSIENGVFIFLDNYLGELDALNNIDSVEVKERREVTQELIPVEKLKDYLNWRQKEFVEKYEGTLCYSDNDTHSVMEADMANGLKLIAVVNSALLEWDCKASHPWIGVLTLGFAGRDLNGMPAEQEYQQLDNIESALLNELRPVDGCLNIGRQTANGEREIYFACKDFRNISKSFVGIQKEYGRMFTISYDIYKDKYWQSFERFIPEA